MKRVHLRALPYVCIRGQSSVYDKTFIACTEVETNLVSIVTRSKGASCTHDVLLVAQLQLFLFMGTALH